jgi:hypothetical protein
MKISADQASITLSDTEHVQWNSGKRRSAQSDLDDPAQIVEEVLYTIAERRWEDRHEQLRNEKRDIAEQKRRLKVHYESQSRVLEGRKRTVEAKKDFKRAKKAACANGKPGDAVDDNGNNESATSNMRLCNQFPSHGDD